MSGCNGQGADSPIGWLPPITRCSPGRQVPRLPSLPKSCTCSSFDYSLQDTSQFERTHAKPLWIGQKSQRNTPTFYQECGGDSRSMLSQNWLSETSTTLHFFKIRFKYLNSEWVSKIFSLQKESQFNVIYILPVPSTQQREQILIFQERRSDLNIFLVLRGLPDFGLFLISIPSLFVYIKTRFNDFSCSLSDNFGAHLHFQKDGNGQRLNDKVESSERSIIDASRTVQTAITQSAYPQKSCRQNQFKLQKHQHSLIVSQTKNLAQSQFFTIYLLLSPIQHSESCADHYFYF